MIGLSNEVRRSIRVHARGIRSCVCAGFLLGIGSVAQAATNGLALSPPLGWSSWSSFQADIDENSIKAIAQIQASTLKPFGYLYINVDAGWYANPDVAIDPFGRWVADANKFPGGMAALGSYIHSLGLKFGLYVTPGIPKLAVTANTPIEGTAFHAADIAVTTRTEVTYLGGTMYYIDYTRPGSQEFVNSWAKLFAAWGVDYLKLDGVGNWDVADIQAWSHALLQTGRPIHLELSNTLDRANAALWSRYSNGWRISGDIEAYNGATLTSWERVALRFLVAPNWLGAAASGGWNDLDSLDAGSSNTGLTRDERQTMATLWALSASPLITGDDLRKLDEFGVSLLTNAEMIGVDQSGVVAAPLNTATQQQVWTALQPDGSYAIGLFNLADSPSWVGVPWPSLGFAGSARVRDLWTHAELGSFDGGFAAPLSSHGSMMLRVTPAGPVRQLLGPLASLSAWAFLGLSTVGPGGQRVQFVGYGSAATFPTVSVTNGGSYNLTINYVNGDTAPRTAVLTVNGNSSQIVFPGTGDWGANLTNQGVTTPVLLGPGNNTITLSNPTGWAPDIIAMTIQSQSAVGPVYKLLSAASGKVIDVLFASIFPGTPIVQWSDHSGANQQWLMIPNGGGYYHFLNRLSGEALDVPNFSAQPGVPLDQWPYTGRSNQNWWPVAAGPGTFVLINQSSGLLVHTAFTWDGAAVDQSPANGTTTQQWIIVPVM